MRRKSSLKDLIKIITQKAYFYSDPITEFVYCLYVDYNFDTARQKLSECTELLENDYFLAGFKDDFMENARLGIFETYCKIHQCIDLASLAQKLDMEVERAEEWIVNLIKHEKMDAKIDARQGTVVMGSSQQNQTIYEQIADRIRDLSIRTFRLANEAVAETT